ncbi:hypothetical protein [Nosocomiicoccus sp. HMSC09A07]|uniref:hypothetical protein n=1 Tax=Nosocomiicoccus sp. HMSC09A07 TaxID=1581145 RepID=UPI00143A6AAC|nr:hypothetical protein [Nosocomiicoccus sp. HMSC09A07]
MSKIRALIYMTIDEASVTTVRNLENVYFTADGDVVIFVQTEAKPEMKLNLY